MTRRFKLAIVATTLFVLAAITFGTGSGRYALARSIFGLKGWFRWAIALSIGKEWDRSIDELEAMRAIETERNIRAAEAKFRRVYDGASPDLKELFELAGLSAQSGDRHVLIRPGNINWGAILSSDIYESHDTTSYRFRPNTRSFFLRQVVLPEGITAIAHLPYRPDVLDAVDRLRISDRIVRDENGDVALHTTNSLGLRGPEPDPSASIRVLVIGDSYMQGFLVGDEDAPPRALERVLETALQSSVSVWNASNQGWGPKEYRAALDYFWFDKPDMVVVSVCPNDFGDGAEVLAGRGDDWKRAEFYLRQIERDCFAANVPVIFCPVPGDQQLRLRTDGRYPGRVADMLHLHTQSYCYPVEAFADAEFAWLREHAGSGKPLHSPLYNGQFGDLHFSPLGARVWANAVGARVAARIQLNRRAAPNAASKTPH